MKPGDTLKLDRRWYLHSGVIQLRVANVHIDGNGATLQATNDETSAIQINADGVVLSNLNVNAPLEGKRWTGLDQNGLVIAANGVTVNDVTVNNSAAAGVFVTGASHFTLNRLRIIRSRADGIHMTNGSNNGAVNEPNTQWTGDDGVAVVSYGNEQSCHDIAVRKAVVTGTTWGRGLSVVGGHDISYTDISVSQSNAAGVYIASEGKPYFTLSTDNVTVSGGSIANANTNSEVSQGAFLVYSANADRTVSRVRITDLTVSATPPSARVNGAIAVDAGAVRDIAFTNIALKANSQPPLYTTPTLSSSNFTVNGWTLDGKPIDVP